MRTHRGDDEMQTFELRAVPNFQISLSADGFIYDMTFRHFRGMTYATVRDYNGNVIAGPVRCCNGKWIIPYPALNYAGAGNFMLIDDNGQYPDFRNFGKSCYLAYYTLEEIANGSSD